MKQKTKRIFTPSLEPDRVCEGRLQPLHEEILELKFENDLMQDRLVSLVKSKDNYKLMSFTSTLALMSVIIYTLFT